MANAKYLRKRIALVAAAALGVGMIVAAPAFAATDAQLAADFTSLSLATATASPAVNAPVVVNLGAVTVAQTPGAGNNVIANLVGYLSSYPTGGSVATTASATASGTTTLLTNTVNSVSGATLIATGQGSGVSTFGNTVTVSSTAGVGSFSFTPTVAGTYVLTVLNDADKNSVANIGEAIQTISITVGSTVSVSPGVSTVYMDAPGAAATAGATTYNTTSDAVARSAAKAAGNNISQLEVTLKNASGTASNGQTVSATLTGSGLILINTTTAATNGTVRAASSGVLTANLAYVHISTDGTAGTGTVTISVTDAVTGATTVVGTKTVTSYGTNSAITATANYTIGKAGGAATGSNATAPAGTSVSTTPAVLVHLTDAAGNGVVGTVAEVSSDVTVVNSDTTGASCGLDNGTASGGTGYYNCQFTTAVTATSGKTATLTFRTNPSGDGVTFLTATVPITIGGPVSTETIALDKATYASGEAMKVTQKAKDSAGNPVYDGAATPAVTSSKAVGGTLPGVAQYVGGTKVSGTNKLFAPASSGDFTLFATSGNTAATPLSVTATVTATGSTGGISPADAAAIAAAKAAADAAIAAVAALSKTVASLVAAITAQIRALSALIKKLLKKRHR